MPAERTTMREIVRLHQAGVSTRQIGIWVGVAASTVRLTLRRVAAAGMAQGIAPEQSDAALERVLFTDALRANPRPLGTLEHATAGPLGLLGRRPRSLRRPAPLPRMPVLRPQASEKEEIHASPC